MTEPQIGTGIADIKVETNAPSAAVEQKSPEMVTTEPKMIHEADKAIETSDIVETTPDSIKHEPSADDSKNAAARQAIEDRIRADNAERQLKELQPKPKELGEQPKIDNFDTLENYNKALIDWAKEVGKQEERTVYNQQEQQRQELATKTAVAQKEQQSRVKHADYDSIINPIVPVIKSIPLLKDFIAKNPMGTEVAYELGKNPAVLEQLMRSDVWSAGEQLINMAARLKAPKPVEITQAPEPIKPVGSRETVRPKLTDLAEKDINGYIATMNKRELARKRAN